MHPRTPSSRLAPAGAVFDRRSERGAALFVAVVAVIVATALAMGLLLLATGRSGQLQERAWTESVLACAEAGLDRGIAEANLSKNRNNSDWPEDDSHITSGDETLLKTADALSTVGTYVVKFVRGEDDGEDNDGDGLKDGDDLEGDEDVFLSVVSTGTVNGRSTTVRGQIELVTLFPNIQSAVFIDDPSPDLNLGNSVSYRVDGRDHNMYTDAVVPDSGSLPAIATTGNFPVADVNKINAKTPDQFNGTSPPYSNTMPDNVDIQSLIDWGAANAEYKVYTGGTNPPGPYGTAANDSPWTEPEMTVTYHDQGAKFTGNKQGAGIWIVNGDLEIGGTLQFTGIIIVKGKVSFSGGGADNHLTGALIAGEAPLINFDTNGTIDILYSSEAVSAATNSMARYALRNWKQEP